MVPKFDPDTVDELFGTEDAEGESEERLRQYFVSNKAYESVIAKGPLKIIVGHKGVGKSALLRHAHLEDKEEKRLSIWLQPSDFVNATGAEQSAPFNKRIEFWKSDLRQIIAKKAVEQITGSQPDKSTAFGDDFIRAIKSIFSARRADLAGAVEQAIADNFLRDEVITVYIDDIDRGWTASRSDIENVSALVNAVRDLTNQDRRFRCRVALRTDVYYLFRTSDESTDKIETNLVWLTWTNDDILRVIAHRINTFFEPDAKFSEIEKLRFQKNITDTVLKKIIEPTFVGRGHWSNRPVHNVLLSLCRARPRDPVKLLHAAAANAFEADHKIISSTDLDRAFTPYSEERLQDLVNEFKSELPAIRDLLLNFKPKSYKGRTSESFQFTTDRLLARIKEIRGRIPLQFTSKKVFSDRDVLSFLYKIDFITARKKDQNGTITRKYFEQSRFLSNSAVDFGFDWEIHPAYRWALQPNDIIGVLNSLGD